MVSSIGVHTHTDSEHQNTELQITRMAIAPNADRKHRHHTGHINVRYNVHKYNSIIPLDSQYSPVRSRPAPQSTARRLEHKNGSISAGTTQNQVIRVALASLHGLLLWQKFYLEFLSFQIIFT